MVTTYYDLSPRAESREERRSEQLRHEVHKDVHKRRACPQKKGVSFTGEKDQVVLVLWD